MPAALVPERIADQLADAGWALVPDLIPAVEARALRGAAAGLLAEGAFREAGVGGSSGERRPEIRSDLIHWLEPDSESAPERRYLARMEALRSALNRTLYMGLESFDGHFAVYPPGSFYRRHLDASPRAPRRAVTCITYLNPGWIPEDGGQLRLYLPAVDEPSPADTDGPAERVLDVSPIGGSTVVFLADRIEHEVLPARRQRVSVTGWFRRRA